MARTPILGTCHVCGTHGKLSFEHVPPKAAFNDKRILRSNFEQTIACETPDSLQGRVQQRGAGGYTLCEKCNNDTGSWYADAYTAWAHQAMKYVIMSRARPSLAYPYNIYPLRVLKQIICMFFSVNGNCFQQSHPDLVRFVLNRDSKALPPKMRVFAFYTYSERMRASGVTTSIEGFGTGSSTLRVMSEITFPPFGFVLALSDSPPPDSKLCNISSFSEFDYRDWRAGISMKLPLMPIYGPFPGDYRTRSQVLLDREESERLASINARAPIA